MRSSSPRNCSLGRRLPAALTGFLRGAIEKLRALDKSPFTAHRLAAVEFAGHQEKASSRLTFAALQSLQTKDTNVCVRKCRIAILGEPGSNVSLDAASTT